MSATAEEVEARAPIRETEFNFPWPRLVLPEAATLEETQQGTDLFFQENNRTKVVAVDMRGTISISILALPDIMSLMVSRKKEGLDTVLVPPWKEIARDMLHQWEVPRAIWTSVGPGHVDTLLDDSFLKERREASGNLVDKFLAFRHIPADAIPGEINNWIAIFDKEVLHNRLNDSETYFGNRVVYEALMNALVVHSQGVEVASRFSDAGTPERNFTWLTWDKGESIIAKIKRSRAKEFLRVDPQNPTSYFVATKDFQGNIIQRFHEGSNVTTLGKVSDYDALIQWLSLQRLSENVHEPSLGMYMLINAACDIYGGEVIVRTNKYRMNIRRRPEELRLSDECAYDITIRKSAPNTPAFVGNMIAVRLPLKPQ